MAILIEDTETDRIVRELAARTGRSITDAVKAAAERELAALPARKGRIDREALDALLASFSARQFDDPRTDDEIIGYDENGLPR